MVQVSATMEQTHETQLAQLYDVLGFQRVITRYDVVRTLHETGPCTLFWLCLSLNTKAVITGSGIPLKFVFEYRHHMLHLMRDKSV